jgi:hypothetical protein
MWLTHIVNNLLDVENVYLELGNVEATKAMQPMKL